jgi:hypothetical protein
LPPSGIAWKLKPSCCSVLVIAPVDTSSGTAPTKRAGRRGRAGLGRVRQLVRQQGRAATGTRLVGARGEETRRHRS